MEWALRNSSFIINLTLTHLYVSLLPLILGSIFAIAMAKLMPRKTVSSFNAVLSAIYAIPSLALFVALPALVGTKFIGPTNVLIALTIYVVSSMFFSARDAFSQVPDSTAFIAVAQGFNRWEKFVHVELPLATPGLIAGLRVAAASTVSMASIGAVVGVKNLGFLFLDGFQRKIPEEVFTGLLAIFIIAISVDALLWGLGKFLSPWNSTRVERA